jgi:hypothetical protein
MGDGMTTEASKSRGGRPRTREWDSTQKSCTISVTAATYDKLCEAATRLGVPIGEIVSRMIERAEQAELADP